MTVAITRLDVAAAALREAAARTKDEGCAADASNRSGAGRQFRADAAQTFAMDWQALRDWVNRYNTDGLDGLIDQACCNGPRPRLSTEQQAAVADWVEQGADLKRDGVMRWRCIDLKQRIETTFGVCLHERTVGKPLHKLSFRRLSVRPQHPQSDPAAQASFRRRFLLS